MHTEILSAFVDGESVDPAQLAAALEDAAARAALVDFVRLREHARADRPSLPASLAALRRPVVMRPRLVQWSAAAALLVFVFLAGLFAPAPWRAGEDRAPNDPPPPVRVERFEPGVDWHPEN